MRYHLVEQLGPKQQLTNEGYLLCEAVPIARIGTQIYAAHEHPELEPGSDGMITVIREASEVFRPETIASFEGKSITIGHAFVDPDNFSELEVGQALNVRQSTEEPDLLVADLLFKDRDAIEKVRVRKGIFGTIQPQIRGISCGYDADYEQNQPGIAYQRNIIGNHVAVVRNPRGGARLSIQDEEPDMPSTLLQKLLRAIRTGDEATVKRTVDEVEAEEKKTADEAAKAEAEAKEKKTADEMADMKKTMDAMAEEIAELKKTKDSAPVVPVAKVEASDGTVIDEASDIVSQAETIAPGVPLPTMDAAAGEAGQVAAKRKILNAGLKTEDGKTVITKLLRGKTVDSLSDDAVGLLFATAAEQIGEARNAAAGHGSYRVQDEKPSKLVTNDEINERNRKFYNV